MRVGLWDGVSGGLAASFWLNSRVGALVRGHGH